jgi:carboxymethylenebutenolidase
MTSSDTEDDVDDAEPIAGWFSSAAEAYGIIEPLGLKRQIDINNRQSFFILPNDVPRQTPPISIRKSDMLICRGGFMQDKHGRKQPGGGVEEHLSEIDGSWHKLPLFSALPEPGHRRGAVIVIHEIFGLNEHIKNVARRFAREGYMAFAPDLFAHAANLPDNRDDLNAMRAVWSGIADADLIADLQQVMVHIMLSHDDKAKVGVIGYCMGGAIALMFGCRTPEVAWIADYYGRILYPELSANKPRHPIDYVKSLNCPVLGLFAGQDQLITAEHIAQLAKEVAAEQPASVIHTYEQAKHAFFNDEREFYDEKAATDAWRKTLDFIARITMAPV